MRDRFVLPCYLLLAAVYLFYWREAEFVIDGWWVFQKFEQARAQGPAAQWVFAGAIVKNQIWGVFRANWLSLLAVFGLYQVMGSHPVFYFLFGVLLHAAVGYLLYLTLVRLEFDRGMAFLAGAVFLLLPTVHNQLFWCTGCGPYLLAAFWFLIYLHSLAGTVATGRLRLRPALVQVLALTLAMFSTDQIFGLLLFAAPWLVLCWGGRAGLAPALLAWSTIGAAGSFYLRVINKGQASGSIAERFDFDLARLNYNLRQVGSDYWKLAGFGDGYYRIASIGWGVLAALGVGLLVFWWLRPALEEQRTSPPRALLFGAGLWAAAYAPVLFLRWREFRYDYLPSLGLAIVLAGGCFALFRPWSQRLLPAGAALLAAYFAAAALADIQQCWRPQSKNLRAIKQQLRRLKDVAPGDIIAIANTPMQIGTAQHFAMILSYCSTPFVEMATGVKGLMVGREIFCETGRLGLQHVDFMYPLSHDDLRRTHIVISDGGSRCETRTLLACETQPGIYELRPLKGYLGPPPPSGLTYSRQELRPMGRDIYFPHRHLSLHPSR